MYQPIIRLTTSPITVQVPSLKRSSGALVIIVLGIFSGKISKTASLILLQSSAVYVGTFVRDCEAVVAVILARITEALAAGDRVELRHFGMFTVRHREARPGRHPRTGAAIDIPARADVRFKSGKGMQRRLNLEPEPTALAAE